MPTILAVAAGKGGVGKSTIALNLALAFQKMKLRVGLMDADFYGPSLKNMLPDGKAPRREGGKIQAASTLGISMISWAHFRPQGHANHFRSPLATRSILQLVHEVSWDDVDYLIVDFPPGTGDIPLSLCQQMQIAAVLLVSTPQIVVAKEVERAAMSFSQLAVPLIGFVENMSYYEQGGEKLYPFGQAGASYLSERLKLPLLARIPLDPRLSALADQKYSLFEEASDSSTFRIFIELAGKLLEKLNGQEAYDRFVSWAIDNDRLFLSWEKRGKLRLSLQKLQSQCPCAVCRVSKGSQPPYEVTSISQIGHYGLQFSWKGSQGCSGGIYSMEDIQKLVGAL